VSSLGIGSMIGPRASSKKMPRGQPPQVGRSGNPRGRPARIAEEVELIEACREKTPEALEVIATLMHESTRERVQLAAAPFLVERG
jgi:hypothetical protein